jgi:hypothetical protein
MMAIPMTKGLPRDVLLYGCGGCHKIGVKTAEDLLALGLERPYGIGATCDQCHSRHAFSAMEARKPEACSKCHMGFDHPQWEMWSTAKHGQIYFMMRDKYPLNVSLKYIEPSDYPGPTCQLCHMPKGSHEVITPWGFLALVAFEGRPEGLEIVEDPEWEAAKAGILKALRVLDPEGKPTPLLEAVINLRIVRADPEEFMSIRRRMLSVCAGCHSTDFAIQYFKSADRVIRETTIQLAEAIRMVAEARAEGIIPPRPEEPENPYPFLLNFYEEPSGIDREAWLIFMEYRMRAFQGMFHVNPDYTFWYGWSEIRRVLRDIAGEIEDARAAIEVAEGLRGVEDLVSRLKSDIEAVKGEVGDLRSRLEDIAGSVEEFAGQVVQIAPGAIIAAIVAVIALAVAIVSLVRRRG